MIFQWFSSQGYPWGTPGGVLRLGGPQTPIFIYFNSIFEPLLGPKLALCWRPWSVLGRLGPSQGGLYGLWNLFFCGFMSIFFRISFYIDFWSILDPKRSPKSIKNLLKIDEKKNIENEVYFRVKFIENSIWFDPEVEKADV